MTKKEIEDYIKLNVKNLLYLNNGYHVVTHLFIFNDSTHRVSLYRINLNSNNQSGYVSRDTNYGCSNAITLASGASVTYIADVNFLFPKFSGDTSGSSYGCSVMLSDVTGDNFSFEYGDTFDGYKYYYLVYNDSVYSDYYYFYDSVYGYYFFTGQGTREYHSLSKVKSFLIEIFKYSDYYTSGSSKFSSYNNFLSMYLICLGSNKERCCLEYC